MLEFGGEPVPEWLQKLWPLLPKELREGEEAEAPGLEPFEAALPEEAAAPIAAEVEEAPPLVEEAEIPDWL
ncbi:MAG: hypothetical protein ACUVV0_15350, partial [Anaerolineae bacterium]